MKEKLTKQERRDAQLEKVRQAFAGTGRFVYKNITKGTYSLPKPGFDGVRQVVSGGLFEGDSYFLRYTTPPDNILQFVKVLEPATPEPVLTEGVKMENKLILDQPTTVTTKGIVEHLVDDKTINETVPNANKKEILLNEAPLDGVEIIIE